MLGQVHASLDATGHPVHALIQQGLTGLGTRVENNVDNMVNEFAAMGLGARMAATAVIDTGVQLLETVNAITDAVGTGLQAVISAPQLVLDATGQYVLQTVQRTIMVDEQTSQWLGSAKDSRAPQLRDVPRTMYHHKFQLHHNGAVARILAGDHVDTSLPTCLFYGDGTSMVNVAGNLVHTLATCDFPFFLKQVQLLATESTTPYAQNEVPLERLQQQLQAVARVIDYTSAGMQSSVVLAHLAASHYGMSFHMVGHKTGLLISALSGITLHAWVWNNALPPVRVMLQNQFSEGADLADMMQIRTYLNLLHAQPTDVQDAVYAEQFNTAVELVKKLDPLAVKCFDVMYSGRLSREAGVPNAQHISDYAGFAPFVMHKGTVVWDPRHTARTMEFVERVSASPSFNDTMRKTLRVLNFQSFVDSKQSLDVVTKLVTLQTGNDRQRMDVWAAGKTTVSALIDVTGFLCDTLSIARVSVHAVYAHPEDGVEILRVATRGVTQLLIKLGLAGAAALLAVSSVTVLVCWVGWRKLGVSHRALASMQDSMKKLDANAAQTHQQMQTLTAQIGRLTAHIESLVSGVQSSAPADAEIGQLRAQLRRVQNQFVLHASLHHQAQHIMRPALVHDMEELQCMLRAGPLRASMVPSEEEVTAAQALHAQQPQLLRHASEASGLRVAQSPTFQHLVSETADALQSVMQATREGTTDSAAEARLHDVIYQMLDSQTRPEAPPSTASAAPQRSPSAAAAAATTTPSGIPVTPGHKETSDEAAAVASTLNKYHASLRMRFSSSAPTQTTAAAAMPPASSYSSFPNFFSKLMQLPQRLVRSMSSSSSPPLYELTDDLPTFVVPPQGLAIALHASLALS